MLPSRTVKVSWAQLTFTQPERSLPLKRLTGPSAAGADAATNTMQQTTMGFTEVPQAVTRFATSGASPFASARSARGETNSHDLRLPGHRDCRRRQRAPLVPRRRQVV